MKNKLVRYLLPSILIGVFVGVVCGLGCADLYTPVGPDFKERVAGAADTTGRDEN